MKSNMLNKHINNSEMIFNDLTPFIEEELCRIIHKKTGIVVVDHQMQKLRDTVSQVCQHFGYSSCEKLLETLKQHTQSLPEFEFIVSAITIGESYFFRDEKQLHHIEKCLTDCIAQKRKDNNLVLRIWSAGCSRGQEIYTIAIILERLLPDIDDWSLHVLGTDINTDVLATAIKGHYSSWSLRATPKDIEERYFSADKNTYKLNREICKRAKFTYLNLVDDSFPSIVSETQSMDLILCRNVFIYLSDDVIYSVMRKFSKALNDSGKIFLGVSEWLRETPVELMVSGTGSSYHYCRSDAIEPPLLSPYKSGPAAVSEVKANPEIQNVTRSNNTKSSSVPGSIEKQTRSAEVEKPEADALKQLLEMIGALMADQQWQEVIQATGSAMKNHGEKLLLLQFRATALANIGQLDSAYELCLCCLEMDPTDKHVCHIMALVLMELNRVDEAEKVLRKAIYLDRQFMEAHYQLGMLMICKSQIAAGLKSLTTALSLAEQGDQQRIVHNSSGTTYERFVHILKSEISMYSR